MWVSIIAAGWSSSSSSFNKFSKVGSVLDELNADGELKEGCSEPMEEQMLHRVVGDEEMIVLFVSNQNECFNSTNQAKADWRATSGCIRFVEPRLIKLNCNWSFNSYRTQSTLLEATTKCRIISRYYTSFHRLNWFLISIFEFLGIFRFAETIPLDSFDTESSTRQVSVSNSFENAREIDFYVKQRIE